MNWFADLFKNKAREAALVRGFAVTEITGRDLPIITGNDQLDSLTPGNCIRYALPRTNRGGPCWSMLQRDKKRGAQLANGYLVTGDDTSGRILDALRPVAEEYAEEYFEFEGTSSEVAVYWEESGGAADVERIYRTLSELQGL